MEISTCTFTSVKLQEAPRDHALGPPSFVSELQRMFLFLLRQPCAANLQIRCDVRVL